MAVGMMVGMAATGLPELDVARIVKYCASRVPEQYRHEIRVECDITPRHVTICECRPPWREDFGPEWTRFPSPACITRRKQGCGRCIGETGTSNFTATVFGSESTCSGFARSHRKRWGSYLLGLIRYRR